jgi:superfamily II DNA or RNA helicase
MVPEVQTESIPTINLVMGNTDTSLYNAGEWILWILDKELRYPTAVAKQKEAQAENPYAPPAPGGSWDGWIRLLQHRKSMPSSFPSGLVPLVSRLLTKWRVPHRIEDARTRPVEGVPEHRGGHTLRDYQEEAVRRGIEVGRGVFDLPPRAGKSLLGIDLVARLGLPVIWIAPTDAIIRQTLRVFEDCLGPHFAVHQVGGKCAKSMNARVVLCTSATAVRLPPEFFNTREVLVVDEWHHGASKTHKEILKLCDHIYFRFGMTGTFFRSGDDAMAMHALLSNTIYKVTTEKLRDLGYLVPGRVVYIPVEAPRLQCPSSDPRLVPQLKYGIQEHSIRNQMVAYTAAYLHRVGRKVLVLVATKAQGNLLRTLIAGQVRPRADGAQYEPVEFLSTNRDRPTQQRILKAYNESDEVEVLLGLRPW